MFRSYSNYFKLIPPFKEFVDSYRAEASKTDKKETTIIGEARNAAAFLAFMQKSGAKSLAEINQKMVVAYFTDQNGTPNKSYSFKKQMTSVFKTCSPLYPECKSILSYLPKLKKRRKNIPYLTADEIAAIKSVLIDPVSPLSLRDKAIGLIALETGLRCCDIAALTMSSIDWDKDLISITQQKTNTPQQALLSTHCGNAIHDYIRIERPQTDASEIFVRKVPPYVRLASRSLTMVAMNIARAAGVRQNPIRRSGFHLYRYHVATALLQNNTPDVVISKVLGHTAPESIEAYLGGDFAHLKEYALGIEDYPVDLGATRG